MPYPGVSKEDTPKVERCVADVMAKKDYEKSRAIAICVSAINGSATLELQAATEEDLLSLQASLDDAPDILKVQGHLPTNTILKFEGACLARAEVNANKDGVTDEGIKQLADTIRLMPLTEEHEIRPRGLFTRGYTGGKDEECLVDGFVWAGHFPEFAEEIRTGVRKLSLDAEAELAVCSICGAAFTTGLDYCEHIRNRTDGAVRWLYDITAVAGGAVLNPAGTGTVFPGADGLTVISHKEESIEPENLGASPTPKLRGGKKKQTGKGGSVMEIQCPECNHEYEVTTEAEELQAELDAKLAELQTAMAAGTDKDAEIEALMAEVDQAKTVIDRFVEMSAVAGVEVAKEALPSLFKVDDDVFQTLLSMASRPPAEPAEEPPGEPPEEDPPAPPVPVMAGGGDPPPAKEGDTWEVTT